jgi:DNA-binding NarL/FixJ family response regulator
MKQSGLLPRPMRSTSPLAHGLTRREREVITLIARGYSNRAIAEALVISEKTAEIHVSNILGKLGVASRTQAAAYAIEHRIVAEVEA